MNILLISPLVYPINKDTLYAGIEKLVWDYAKELIKEHDVTVMGHEDSVYPEGVKHLKTKPKGDPFVSAELFQYQSYQYKLRKFDVIHDFSHQHFACRYNYKLPAVNVFWHAPRESRFPKAPYNIIAPSEWAANEFRLTYQQGAVPMQCITVDSEVYHPEGERGDRFLTLGIMHPNKGNLAAIMLCLSAGVPIDVVGKFTGEDEEYEKNIRRLHDGHNVNVMGEVSQEEKVKLMQKCKALIYAIGYEEVTSHKIPEAMCCGAPIITSPAGALPEIITSPNDGFLCRNEGEYLKAINGVGSLEQNVVIPTILKYSAKKVCSDFVELYKKVKGGEQW